MDERMKAVDGLLDELEAAFSSVAPRPSREVALRDLERLIQRASSTIVRPEPWRRSWAEREAACASEGFSAQQIADNAACTMFPIEPRKLDDVPDPGGPICPDVLMVARSVNRLGFLNPIVVRSQTRRQGDDRIVLWTVTCGTHRRRAAELLGWTQDIPVVFGEPFPPVGFNGNPAAARGFKGGDRGLWK